MSDRTEKTRLDAPTRVFTREFLAAIRREDAVSNALDAARSRPLSIVLEPPGRWQVVTVGSGDRLLGRFTDRELALLFCAAYPSAGRTALLELGSEPEDGWYPLWWSRGESRETCGELPLFDHGSTEAMKTLVCVAANPVSLSYLLQFAGWEAIDAADARGAHVRLVIASGRTPPRISTSPGWWRRACERSGEVWAWTSLSMDGD